MHVSNIEALEVFTTKDGSQIRELVAPAWTPAKHQSLAEATVGQGAATAEHYHRETEELYFLLEGSGRMRVGDAERDVAAGDCVVIPAGERHKLCNTGDGPLRLLCCCVPAYADEDTVITE
ncbi:MAG: cupin domain-containing protein [Solirubrobacteraceae bacterium]